MKLANLITTIIFFFFLGTISLASELVVDKTKTTFTEDFDSFQGTMDTLPAGFTVSNDGSTLLTNDYDYRGIHDGGTREGACIAWNMGNGDHALGYQPTEDEFTPGHFMVKISNATSSEVAHVSVEYDVVCLNNADRSSTLDLEISPDGNTFTRLISFSYTSPALADENPAWKTTKHSGKAAIPQPISNGKCFYIRWSGDDAGGSGSRDEYGINNFKISLHPPKGTIISLY